MQNKGHLLKGLMNFKVFGVLVAMVVVISYLSFSGTYTKLNKDAHSTAVQKVYTSQSTKSKSLGSFKKNQNIYVYGKQNKYYKVKIGTEKGWISTKNVKMGKYVAPAVKINKDGHSTKKQTVYTSKSTKSKSLGSLKKNQNTYIYASQKGWYQVKIGKSKGWIPTGNAKVGKYVATKTYADGWVAPVLKSSWSKNQATNFATLQNELGFYEDGHVYGIKGKSRTIIVNDDDGANEVTFKFYSWTDRALSESYRIPIVAKELFKLYFGADANRVWNYCNNNDIPEKFTANGRTVKVSFIEGDGSIYFEVGNKK